MGSKKQNQAIQALEQKMANSPQSRAFSRLAELHRESGNLQTAVNICVAGVAEHPRYVTGRLVLGRCYKQQGDLPAAFDELTKVCEIDARNHAALRMLADIFMVAGRPEAAGSLYAILCEMEPDNHEMRARAAKNKLRMGGSAAEILAQVKALGLVAAPPKPLPAPPPAVPLPLPPQAAGAPQEQVSGDDVAERLDDIYKDAEPSVQPPVDASGAGQISGDDVVDKLDQIYKDAEPPIPPTETSDGQISGDDIVDQLDQIYKDAEPPIPPTETSDGQISGDDIVDQLDQIYKDAEPSIPPAVEGSSADDLISGDDVADQLSRIYGEEAAAAYAPLAQIAEPESTEPEPAAEELGELNGWQTLSMPEEEVGALSLTPMESDPSGGAAEELDELFGGRSELAPEPEIAPAEPDFPDITDEIEVLGPVGLGAEAAPAADDAVGMEDQLSALFGEPEESAIGVGGEEVLIFGDGAGAQPVAELGGDVTDALPVAELEGDVTDALPVAEVVGDVTDALPEELIVDAMDASLSDAPDAVDEGPKMPVVVDENGEDVAAMPVGAGEVGVDDGGMWERVEEETGVKDDLMVDSDVGDAAQDVSSGMDIDAFASAIDAEIEASGAVIDPVSDIDVGTDINTTDIGTDLDALASAIDAEIEASGAVIDPVSDIDVGTDINTTDIGTDLDALASAIDAEIEASGAVIDPVSDIDVGTDINTTDIGTDIDASTVSEDVLDGAGADDLEARLSELFNDGLYADSQPAEGVAAEAAGGAIDTDVVAVDTDAARSVPSAADAMVEAEDDGSITAMISKIDVIEAEDGAAASATPTTPEADADEVQEKLRQLFNAEEEGAPKTLDIGLDASGVDLSLPTGGPDERDTPFDLPDHVLTSTLADIYYQQGQPQLALHIYERLFQRDPKDLRLADKIEEIREVLQAGGDGGGGEPQRKAELAEKAPRASSGRKKKGAGGAKEELDIRPLAGVRIKKSAPAKKGKRAKKS